MYTQGISIHPPREGWDLCDRRLQSNGYTFQSTHPVRGGTFPVIPHKTVRYISIHPPREGWDSKPKKIVVDSKNNFNPPTP